MISVVSLFEIQAWERKGGFIPVEKIDDKVVKTFNYLADSPLGSKFTLSKGLKMFAPQDKLNNANKINASNKLAAKAFRYVLTKK